MNQPKAKLPRNQSPAGRRLQMASDGNECAGRGSRRDRDNEAVLSRAVHPEWRTGGAVGRKIAAASRRDHLAARYKLPAVYSARDYASVGGVLSYGPDQIGH